MIANSIEPIAVTPALERRRLMRQEIALLRDLASRAGVSGRVTLSARQRGHVVELWRRGVVEVWYRQSCDAPSLRGPFYGLSMRGFRLASAFLSTKGGSLGLQRQGA